MTSRRLLFVLLALVVLLAVLNLLTKKPTEYDVRVVTPPAIIASLPHWVAEERKLYSNLQLNVSTLPATSSDLMAQALYNRDADVLPAVSLANVLNLSEKATMRPVIFSYSRMRAEPPFDSLLVLRGSRFSNLRDLEGQRIAVYPGTTATAALRHFLRENSVDISGIEFIPLKAPEHLLALQRGDVAASLSYEPLRTQYLQAGRTREIAGSVYAFLQEPCAIGVSAMSPVFINEHREAAKRYLKAWDEAVIFIRNNPEDARKILADRLGLPPKVAQAATWVDVTTSTEVEIEELRNTAALFQGLGVITSEAEPETLFAIPETFFAVPEK